MSRPLTSRGVIAKVSAGALFALVASACGGGTSNSSRPANRAGNGGDVSASGSLGSSGTSGSGTLAGGYAGVSAGGASGDSGGVTGTAGSGVAGESGTSGNTSDGGASGAAAGGTSGTSSSGASGVAGTSGSGASGLAGTSGNAGTSAGGASGSGAGGTSAGASGKGGAGGAAGSAGTAGKGGAAGASGGGGSAGVSGGGTGGSGGAGCNLTTPASTTTHRAIGVHDPSMIHVGSSYYLFATGGLLNVRSSTDLATWKNSGNIFAQMPAWIATELGQTITALWAPDISFYNGLYHVYYAGSIFGKNHSVIGLATNTTLNPSDAGYKWVDQGLVIESNKTGGTADNWNAIDPNLTFD
ncbi:MAG TPA: family 43 glycosylhydrolase, partial [Polyangiaceae bacterium]